MVEKKYVNVRKNMITNMCFINNGECKNKQKRYILKIYIAYTFSTLY